MGQAQAGHDHELQHIVQRCGIAHAGLDDGAYILDVAQRFGGEHGLARLHPGPVATDGIDFSIVRHEPERLRQSPCRKRIGGETGMHHRQTARKVGLRQVGEILAQLGGGEHSFIYNVL